MGDDARERRRPSFQSNALAVYLALGLAVGGAGIDYPLLAAAIEGLGLVLLAQAAWARPARLWLSPSPAANLLLLAVLVLPLLQLVPLPWTTWASLPGHATAAALLEAAGLAGRSRAASLDPAATLGSWIALLPPAALFLLASRASPAEQRRLAAVAVGIALLSALAGAVQKASGGDSLSFFPSAHSPNGPGLFVNRNHQATFLLMAMPVAAAIARTSRRPAARLIGLGLIALFGAATVATTSRMGIALLPIAAIAAVLILYPPRLSPMRLLAPIGGLALAALLVLQTSGAQAVIGRFASHDLRFDYWADTWPGIAQYWPWGSGFGTFPDVFPSLENLDVVERAIVLNAHNDWLELMLDGGLPALVLVAAFLALLGWIALRVLRAPRGESGGPMKAAAFAAVAIVLIHSTVDYPLRMYSLSLWLALTMAILVAPARARSAEKQEDKGRRSRSGRAPLPARLAAIAGCAALLLLVGQRGLAGHLLVTGNPAAAQQLAPGLWRAATASGIEALRAGDLAAARRQALAGIAAAPMRPEPATLLAAIEQQQGRREAAARLIAAIAPLGWRHAPAQLWMVESALDQGNAASAVLRADALLRQGQASERMIPLLRGLLGDPAAGGLIADRLAVDPPWRGAFLKDLRTLKPGDVGAHAALLERLHGSAAPPTEEETSAFSTRLIADGRYAAAEELWARLAPPGRGAIDGGSPFGWTSRTLPGVTIEGDGEAIRIALEGSAAGVAMERLARLSPGRHAISAEVQPAGAAESLRWRIACDRGKASLESPVLPDPALRRSGRTEQVFDVPETCPAVRIALWIDHQDPGSAELVVNKILISPGDKQARQ